MAAHPWLELGFFMTASISCTLLTPTTGFDDRPSPTMRWCYFNIRCVHPSFNHCEGRLWYCTSSRFCECLPHYDSGGTLPSALQGRTSYTCQSRTQWPTTRTTLSLGRFGATCASALWEIEGDTIGSIRPICP